MRNSINSKYYGSVYKLGIILLVASFVIGLFAIMPISIFGITVKTWIMLPIISASLFCLHQIIDSFDVNFLCQTEEEDPFDKLYKRREIKFSLVIFLDYLVN